MKHHYLQVISWWNLSGKSRIRSEVSRKLALFVQNLLEFLPALFRTHFSKDFINGIFWVIPADLLKCFSCNVSNFSGAINNEGVHYSDNFWVLFQAFNIIVFAFQYFFDAQADFEFDWDGFGLCVGDNDWGDFGRGAVCAKGSHAFSNLIYDEGVGIERLFE